MTGRYFLSVVNIATDLTLGVLERIKAARGVIGRWVQ